MLRSEQESAFDKVLRSISAGTAQRIACRKIGLNSKVFYRMLREESKLGEERRIRYARAKDEQLEAFAADTIALADAPMLSRRVKRSPTGTTIETYDNVERSRLAVETRKWHLAKLKPKVFGDKVDHKHEGTVNLTLSQDEAKVL